MRDPEELLRLGDEAVDAARRAGADEAELAVTFAKGASVDFENNDIAVAISDEELSYGVRVFKDGRSGFATANDVAHLHQTVQDALALAATSLPDPHNGLPSPRPVEFVAGLDDEKVADLTVGSLTRHAGTLLARVRQLDARPSIDSGTVGAVVVSRAIVSTAGVRVGERTSRITTSLFGMAVEDGRPGSFVVEAKGSRSADQIAEDIEGCAEGFVLKALGALNPGKGRSYRGAVLFSPQAVHSLLVSNLSTMISSPFIRKGRSPLGGKLGDIVASPLLTLTDRPDEPGAYGASSFDREGQPRRPFTLIDRGRFAAIPYNHYEARAADQPEGSTGHASGGAENLPGVGFSRLELAAGPGGFSEAIEAVGEIIEVTRFSGSTNVVTGEFSGVVKAGFLRKGNEKRPVTEVLIAGNLLDAYRSVLAVSEDTERLLGLHTMPALLVDGVSVTAG